MLRFSTPLAFVFSLLELLLGLLLAVTALLGAHHACKIVAIQAALRPLLGVACATELAGCTELLQTLVSSLNSRPIAVWVNMSWLGVALAISVVLLFFARYRREAVALFALFAAEVAVLAITVIPLLPPVPPIIDLVVAWSVIGAMTLFPFRWGIRLLVSLLPAQQKVRRLSPALASKRGPLLIAVAALCWPLICVPVFSRQASLWRELPFAFLWAGALYSIAAVVGILVMMGIKIYARCVEGPANIVPERLTSADGSL